MAYQVQPQDPAAQAARGSAERRQYPGKRVSAAGVSGASMQAITRPARPRKSGRSPQQNRHAERIGLYGRDFQAAPLPWRGFQVSDRLPLTGTSP